MDTDDYSPQKILIFVTFKIDNINNIRYSQTYRLLKFNSLLKFDKTGMIFQI